MASESLKSLKETSSEPVDKMLDRYEDRASRGLIEKKEMERTFGIVDKALKTTKERLNDPAFFLKLSPEEIAKLSNAWKAWGSEALIPDPELRRELASVLMVDKTDKKKDRALMYARQIWRTEITTTLIHLLGEDPSKPDGEKSDIVEKIMASQVVHAGEDSSYEALMVSMHLDEALGNKAAREKIAAQMDASSYKVTTKGDYSQCLNALGGVYKELKDERHVTGFRVTVGGELLEVPEAMRESLMLKNVAFVGDRIYAQMANGCEGNLVVIDLENGPAPVDPDKPPVDPDKPPVDPNDPNPTPFVGGLGGDSYIYARGENGNLIPSSNQFDERAGMAIVSDELLKNYETSGFEPFLDGLKKVPAAQQEAVLATILEKLGAQDPARAFALLQEISRNVMDASYPLVLAKMREMEADPAANESTKAFWRLQIGLFQGEHENAQGPQLPALFKELQAIDPAQLSAELRPWYESNKQSMEFFTKKSLASDMVGTAFSVMTSNFDPEDQEDLDQHIKEGTSRAEWVDMLDNNGIMENLDTDEEVYVSAWQVLEALRLAIAYQYPKDLLAGVKVENPVKYYYEQLKSGALFEIEIPADLATQEVLSDPLGNNLLLAPGSKFYPKDYFISYASEFRIFEDYQSGNEKLGSNTWLNLYEGNQAAFMGEGSLKGALGAKGYAGGKGLIEGSDDVLLGSPFEQDYKLGGSEKLYCQKMTAAMNTKHYDELRQLCLSALGSKIEGAAATAPEVQARFTELYNEEGGNISAGLRLALQENELTDADIQRIDKPDGTGKYVDTADYVNFNTRAALTHRAEIELECERAESLHTKYFNSVTGIPDVNAMVKDGFTHLQIFAITSLVQIQGWGYFNLQEENSDTTANVVQTLAEIAIIEAATCGVGTAIGVGMGGARVAGAGSRALGTGVAAVEAGEVVGIGLRAGTLGRLGASVGRSSVAARLTAANAYTGGRLAVAGRNIGHAAFFVEAQSLMHGTTLDPTSWEGAKDATYQVATMAATFYALGKTQQFMRGQTAGARAVVGTPATLRSVATSPLASASRSLGDWNAAWRTVPGAGASVAERAAYAGRWSTVNALEVGTEVAVLHNVASLQLSAGEFTGVLSADQAEAMRDPHFWRSILHTTGVVVGLRAVGGAQQRREPPPVEPPVDGRYSGPNGERTVIDPNFNIPNDGVNNPMVRYEPPVKRPPVEPVRPEPEPPVRPEPEPPVRPEPEPPVRPEPEPPVRPEPEPPVRPEPEPPVRPVETPPSLEAVRGKNVRVRLENGDVVDGRVLDVYNLPGGTPNGSFRIEFKDPGNGGVREYTAWKEQITDKPLTKRTYRG